MGSLRAGTPKFDDHCSSGGKNLILLRTIQIEHDPRDWRLRCEQSRTNALYLSAVQGLISQLRAGNGVGEIDDQAVGMG